MLSAMRSKSVKWVSQIFVALIAISFSAWGISDVFIGGGENIIANVGKEKISVEDFRQEVQNMIVSQAQISGEYMTPQEARAAGIYDRALDILIQRAVLNAEIAALGLSIDQKTVLDHIRTLPQFQKENGDFDTNAYAGLLSNNRLSEGQYINIERGNMLRSWLISAATGENLVLPDIMTESLYIHFYEQRRLKAVILPVPPLDTVALPTNEDILMEFYDQHHERYTIPRLAKISLLILRPEEEAQKIDVDMEDVRQFYENNRDSWGVPERRHVMRLSFPSLIEANRTREKLKNGADFIAFAKENNRNRVDYDLGPQSRGDIGDENLAETIFSLKEGEISDPVESTLGGIFLIYVEKIFPEDIRPFEDVKDGIAQERRLNAARDEIIALFDGIEDQRIEGATLSEIGQKIDREIINIDGMSREGLDSEGEAISAIANTGPLLRRIFTSEASLDEEALELPDGSFIWYEIHDFIEPVLRPFSEVKNKVADGWRAERLLVETKKKAQALIEEAKKDALSLNAIAQKIGRSVQEYGPHRRGFSFGPIDMKEEDRIFSSSGEDILLLKAHESFIEGSGKNARRTFAIGQISKIVLDRGDGEKDLLDGELRTLIGSELFSDYIDSLRDKHSVSINRAVLSALMEGGSNAY